MPFFVNGTKNDPLVPLIFRRGVRQRLERKTGIEPVLFYHYTTIAQNLERVNRLERSHSTWKDEVLPLHHTRSVVQKLFPKLETVFVMLAKSPATLFSLVLMIFKKSLCGIDYTVNVVGVCLPTIRNPDDCI